VAAKVMSALTSWLVAVFVTTSDHWPGRGVQCSVSVPVPDVDATQMSLPIGIAGGRARVIESARGMWRVSENRPCGTPSR
jgi:hypothetical protein